jgi:AcrR family transcriptional regulator
MSTTTSRSTAAARRDEVLDAAMIEFFGTKKELFKASVARCLRETLEMFQRAAEGKRGEDALKAIGQAYQKQLEEDRMRLRAQMQAYAACDDPEIRDVVRAGFGDLVAYVRRVSGADWPTVWGFFSTGMLLNVLASMHVDNEPEPWMQDLLSGSGKEL